MANSIKFIAGHLEGAEYVYFPNKNKMTCTSKAFGKKTLFLTDFKEMEVTTEENIKKLGGTIGSAVIGGILLVGLNPDHEEKMKNIKHPKWQTFLVWTGKIFFALIILMIAIKYFK